MANVTLREVLNKIIVDSMHKMWIMNTAQAKKKFFELSFDQ